MSEEIDILSIEEQKPSTAKEVEICISTELSTRMKTTDGFKGGRKDRGEYTVAQQATIADAFAIITEKHMKATDPISTITIAKAKAEAIKRAEHLEAAKAEE